MANHEETDAFEAILQKEFESEEIRRLSFPVLSGISSSRNPHVSTIEDAIRDQELTLQRVSGTTTVPVGAEGNRSRSGSSSEFINSTETGK